MHYRNGVTENELESIQDLYHSLIIEKENEIASKILVRRATYLTKDE